MDHPLSIIFVKGTGDDTEAKSTKAPKAQVEDDGATIKQLGLEAKSFYENLVTSDSVPKEDDHPAIQGKHKRKSKSKSQSTEVVSFSDRDKRQFFIASQSGDNNKIRSMFGNGFDIDCVDLFGWTGLMMAVCAAHEDTVKLFLDLKADRSKTTYQGETVFDLALKKRLSSIHTLLCTYGFKSEKRETPCVSQVPEQSWHKCTVCQMDIGPDEVATHATSVVHLLNQKKKVSYPDYSIPETNRGFQMMLRSGWNKEHGLGPQGEGKKFPVKTMLKRDRLGLGIASKDKMKVTHFNPKDTKAVEDVKNSERTEKCSTLKRKALSTKAKREAEKEKRFRREFY